VDFRAFFDGVGERAVGFDCEVVATGRGGRWLVVGNRRIHQIGHTGRTADAWRV